MPAGTTGTCRSWLKPSSRAQRTSPPCRNACRGEGRPIEGVADRTGDSRRDSPMTASLDAAVASALADLAGLAPARVEMFELRLRRWWHDLRDGLAGVYGDRADDLAAQLARLAAVAYRERDPELRRLDLARILEPDWF